MNNLASRRQEPGNRMNTLASGIQEPGNKINTLASGRQEPGTRMNTLSNNSQVYNLTLTFKTLNVKVLKRFFYTLSCHLSP